MLTASDLHDAFLEFGARARHEGKVIDLVIYGGSALMLVSNFREQAVALGRGRYELQGENGGYRNGYENGTLKTGEGILRVKAPQIQGQAEPYRSQLWSQVSRTSEVLKKLIVEMYVGECPSVYIEQGLESAVGHFLLSQSTVSDIAERLVFGVLIRVSDRWGKKRFSDIEQHQIRSLRAQLKLDDQDVSMSEPSSYVPTRRSAASAA